MPLYQYQCENCRWRFDQRAGFDDTSWPCPRCLYAAERVQVYREQYISCETGPKGGTKSEPPREEKSYRKQFQEYREAAQELDYAYSRVPEAKAPNYYKAGVKAAKKRGAKLRA